MGQKTTYPKFKFLLGFRSFNFEIEDICQTKVNFDMFSSRYLYFPVKDAGALHCPLQAIKVEGKCLLGITTWHVLRQKHF